jgi:choline monooxygenase
MHSGLRRTGSFRASGPERTAGFIDYFFAPDVDRAWIDELVEFDNQVGA